MLNDCIVAPRSSTGPEDPPPIERASGCCGGEGFLECCGPWGEETLRGCDGMLTSWRVVFSWMGVYAGGGEFGICG